MTKKTAAKTVNSTKTKGSCGIIMPISKIDQCPAEHWVDVKKVIVEAVKDAGYDAKIVSESNEIGVLQKNIVQNLYQNEIVVCDVSCKNPNVMFELGMRLAFDKPVIVIKDDSTDYAFDTSIIEHLSYPRSLDYFKIIEFKNLLSNKIVATCEAAKKDPNYSTFLKNFTNIKPGEIEQQNMSALDTIMLKMEKIESKISSLSQCNSINPLANKNITKQLDDLLNSFCSARKIEKIELWFNSDKIKDAVAYINEKADWAVFYTNDELIDLINKNIAPF